MPKSATQWRFLSAVRRPSSCARPPGWPTRWSGRPSCMGSWAARDWSGSTLGVLRGGLFTSSRTLITWLLGLVILCSPPRRQTHRGHWYLVLCDLSGMHVSHSLVHVHAPHAGISSRVYNTTHVTPPFSSPCRLVSLF